jgi:hypothetical protein
VALAVALLLERAELAEGPVVLLSMSCQLPQLPIRAVVALALLAVWLLLVVQAAKA